MAKFRKRRPKNKANDSVWDIVKVKAKEQKKKGILYDVDKNKKVVGKIKEFCLKENLNPCSGKDQLVIEKNAESLLLKYSKHLRAS